MPKFSRRYVIHGAWRFRWRGLVPRCQPVGVCRWADLRWLNLGTAAPEHVRIADRYPYSVEMLVNRGFVREHQRFVRPMRDGHQVHVGEVRAAFAPVGVREDIVPADLAAGFDFAAWGDAPMEKRIVARDADAGARRFDVL